MTEIPVQTFDPAEVEKAQAFLTAAGYRVSKHIGCAWLRAINWTACATATLGRAIACGYRLLDGFKSFLFWMTAVCLGLSENYGGLDLTGLIEKFLPADSQLKAGDIITIMGIAGISLRMLSNGPAFRRWRERRSYGDGVARGVGTGSVDEPRDCH